MGNQYPIPPLAFYANLKSLAGEFVYGYDEANPALLTKMTGPVHEVETSYEPHRNLVTGVVNKAKPGGARSPLPESPDAALAGDSEPGTLSSYTYANDLLGRRETISQGGEAFGTLALGQNKVEVAYNDRSEVTGAVYRSNTETRQNFEYTYDAIGNRERTVSEIDSKRSELSYETNALNQYKKISANQRQLAVPYDLDGNLLEDARNTYTWNADNNLVRVEAKDGTLRLDYLYDYQSRRTVRTETKQPGTKNEEQRSTYYLYDDWNVIAELSESSSQELGAGSQNETEARNREASQLGTLNFKPATLLSWGRDLSGTLQGAGGVGGLLAITTRESASQSEGPSTKDQAPRTGDKTRFVAYDANGNIGQILDESGHAVAAYAYEPFGNVTEMAGAEAEANPWRFSTKPVETGTGWLYYGFRYYQPETGRWLGRDPIGENGGVNLYGFVGNIPTGAVDFLGREPTPVSGGFGFNGANNWFQHVARGGYEGDVGTGGTGEDMLNYLKELTKSEDNCCIKDLRLASHGGPDGLGGSGGTLLQYTGFLANKQIAAQERADIQNAINPLQPGDPDYRLYVPSDFLTDGVRDVPDLQGLINSGDVKFCAESEIKTYACNQVRLPSALSAATKCKVTAVSGGACGATNPNVWKGNFHNFFPDGTSTPIGSSFRP